VVRSLLLAASFPPALGGIETLLYQTERRLQDPPVVLAPPPASAPGLAIRHAPLRRLDRALYRPLWRAHPALHYLARFWAPALRAVRETQPRVLQAGHVYLAPLAWLLSRRLHLPYVVYAYGQEVDRTRPSGLAALDRVLRGCALANAGAVLTPGTFTSALLARWGVDARVLTCVPYGAEPRPAAPPPTGQTLLSVARLIERKGIDTVIRALARLDPEITYRVVGSGPDLPRLERLAGDLGVAARVRFLGRLDAADLEREYATCSAFVLPARRTADGDLEGYGLVYFEAAAWGRPVIAGRSGGEVDAVVDGQTGLLVDGASVEAVADAIGRLLGDISMMQRLGAAGRARVESSHNWNAAARAVDGALSALAC
jgi:phosphatidyl-myo-inositol dimannoside synthase